MQDKLTPKEKIELGIYLAGLVRSAWLWIRDRREKRKNKNANQNEKNT